MAFETGTFTNSHQLIQKLNTFLRSVGWQEIAALRGNLENDGYDFVMKSTGKFDDREIYIRIAAGLYDYTTIGDVQLPLDGYTEHINGLAYQYFPAGGTSASDGIGELGVYGPILCYQQNSNSAEGSTAYFDVDELNLWKFAGSGRPGRKKVFDWTSSGWSAQSSKPSWFDGKYIFHCSMGTGSGYYWRVNAFDGTYTYFSSQAPLGDSGSDHWGGDYVRTRDRREYAYFIMSAQYSQKTYYLTRVNIAAQTTERGFSNNCPFTLAPPGSSDRCPMYGFGPVVGTKRKRVNAFGLPQHRMMYVGCGTRNWDAVPKESNEWAYVDAETGSWASSIITPSLPWTIGFWSHPPAAIYVMKERTGYTYDRLYVFRGNTQEFASIAIDDDGYATGSWFSHQITPYVQTYGGQAAFVAGNKLCWIPGSVWANNYDRTLCMWQFPSGNPEQVGSWQISSSTFLDSPRSSGPHPQVLAVHEHLCNRAHVSEFSTNKYWAFADKNRLVVVVKDADGKYNYIYAGLFQPYSDVMVTRTTADISAGATSIPVEDASIFAIGNKYMIIETTGVYQTITNYFGTSKKVSPAEMFTVAGISGNTLIVQGLTYAYKANALVGSDPLPLMVRVHSLEYAQTLNNISISTPKNLFSDPCWQRYRLAPTVDNTFANATDIDERAQAVYIYGIALTDAGDSYTGKEVRGQLYNVYSCGTGVASEATVPVGSDTYIAFDIDESGETQRIVVGPI